MKTRTGFVSNSSSSSFIVGFKKAPQSVDEVKTLLFGDGQYLTAYDYSMSTWDIASRVFKDMQGKKPATQTEILEEIKSGYFDGYPPYNYNADTKPRKIREEFAAKFPQYEKGNLIWQPEKLVEQEAKELATKYRIAQDEEWAAERKAVDDAAQKYADEVVLPALRGLEVYTFSYADEDGECVLEHGDIFSNVTHFAISHH